jgi:protein-tyrosine phosphatase
MIDIHTHILPATDDGAFSVADSLAMLAMASADGTTDIVLTPHANLKYAFYPSRAAADRRRLGAAVPGLRLHAGCELLITPENLERAIADPSGYTIAGGSYLLVELPECVGSRIVLDALARLQDRGIKPVIAHPERSLSSRDVGRTAGELVQRGCYLQLTARSILGGFGTEAARTAEHLLKYGLAHFVASDAHGKAHRRPLLGAARARVAQIVGPENAELLFAENGRAVLADGAVQPMSKRPARARSIVLLMVKRFSPQRAGANAGTPDSKPLDSVATGRSAADSECKRIV